MITSEFSIKELELNYSVGIIQVKFKAIPDLTFLFNYLEDLNQLWSESIIQLFSTNFIINEEHVYNACYFAQKAFLQGSNISKALNIELFLYLAANRQIKLGLQSFGLTDSNIKTDDLILCLISKTGDLELIKEHVLKKLCLKPLYSSFNQTNHHKLVILKNFFEISDDQLNVVLKSRGHLVEEENLVVHISCLNELVCEKMSLLSLEKK